MTKDIIKAALLSLTVLFGGMAASSTTATASNIDIGFNIGGAGIYFSGGSPRRGFRGYRPHRGGYEDRRYRPRVCNPRKAIRKARRMGLHRARIVRVNRNAIVAKGYRWGSPTRIKFGRSARCPVWSVRSGY